MTQTLKINGMTCEACTKLTAKRLQKIDGVSAAEVDLASGLASIEAERPISADEANDAFAGMDYSAEEYDDQDA